MTTLMTTKQVCEMLSVDPATINRWRKRGLPCIKIGPGEKAPVRFEHDKVMEWVKQQNREV